MKNSKIPIAGDSRYGFETFFKEDGMYYFRFNDLDGEPIMFSRGYLKITDRADAIDTAINNAHNSDYYDLKKSKSGKHYFVLKSDQHTEIGRSRLFVSRKEMEKKMALLTNMDSNVPLFEAAEAIEKVADAPAENIENQVVKTGVLSDEIPATTTNQVVPKNEQATADPEEITADSAATQDNADKMSRYKFSVIYYPNSKIWMIKNDFSGESKQLKTCDGQQIEVFLKAQLPADELKVKPAATVLSPGKFVRSTTPQKPEKSGPRQVNLNIRTFQGEVIQKFTQRDQIQKIEALPLSAQGVNMEHFEAKVTVKCLEDNQTILIGTVKNQMPADDRFVIPIQGARYLNPGAYLFITRIYQNKETSQPVEFYGSQLVVLN